MMSLGNSLKICGSVLFMGGAQFFLCLIIAEALYPGYSVSEQFVSDLGATCHPSCVIYQPSSIIFNSSVFLLGLLGLIGSFFIYRIHYRLPAILFMVGSIGAIGVGIFPETAGQIHILFAFMAFLFIGLSAIASYRIGNFPMSYFSLVLGIIILITLLLSAMGLTLGLGNGGIERVILYPSIIWIIGTGAYMLGRTSSPAVAP
jgi:hypothetical membrane protein